MLVEKNKRVREVVSDRNSETVRLELMKKTKDLYCKLEDSFDGLSRNAKGPHVREMLKSFASEAGNDCRELDTLVSGNFNVNVETAEKNFGMFAHLLSADDRNLSDEERAIVNALKISDNLRNVFSLMAKEYSDKKIKTFFEKLSKHENYRINELEQLYDDLVVRGEW